RKLLPPRRTSGFPAPRPVARIPAASRPLPESHRADAPSTPPAPDASEPANKKKRSGPDAPSAGNCRGALRAHAIQNRADHALRTTVRQAADHDLRLAGDDN